MRSLFFIILFLFSSVAVQAQDYIDCSDWLASDYTSDRSLTWNVSFFVGGYVLSSGSYAYAFTSDGLISNYNDYLRHGQGYNVLPVSHEFSDWICISGEVPGVVTYVNESGAAVLAITMGGKEYRASLPTVNRGVYTWNGGGGSRNSDFEFWTLDYIHPSADSLLLLAERYGNGGVTPPSGGGSLGALRADVQQLLALLQSELPKLHFYAGRCAVVCEYGVGVLSFICGILLAFILFYGLKLR